MLDHRQHKTIMSERMETNEVSPMIASLSAFLDHQPLKNILGHRAHREIQYRAQRGLAN